jgi:YfiH family protein
MIIEYKNDIHLLKFDILNKQKNITHFITTRYGGTSQGLYSSLNLSLKVGDINSVVTGNRSLLASALKIKEEQIVFPDQCHTNHVKEVHSATLISDLADTDALITQTTGVCLCVLTADCVPILLYDAKEHAIAAIHAGWRGTAGRIIPRTIEQMVKVYYSQPKNIMACMGPAISQKNYEVGDEVADNFRIFFQDVPSVIRKNKESGKFHIDLWEANRQLLLRYGVQPGNIEISNLCTYNIPEWFFSARRDGIQCGRFGTGIMLL